MNKKLMKKKLLKQMFFWLAAVVFLFGISAEAQTKRPKKKLPKQKIEQMSDKIIYAPDADLLKETQEQVSVVESKKDWAQFNRQSPTVSRNGNRSAYIAQFSIEPGSDALIDVIVVYEKPGDKAYEIRGFAFPRPFEDLKWTDDDTLQFDQWVNPTRGGRYRINLKTGKVVSAGYLESKE